MITLRHFVSVLLATMLMVTLIPLTAQAVPPDIWVDLGGIGTVRNNQANADTDPNCVVLAPADGTLVEYGNATIGKITIQRKSAGSTARVCRISDQFLDYLTLVNAFIKRTAGPVTNFPITAWAVHLVAPNATLGTPYYYNTEIAGTFSGPAGTTLNNSKFVSTGKIQPNASGPWDPAVGATSYTVLGCVVNSACTKAFTRTVQFGPFDNLADQPRGLKNEMQLTLRANGQTLTFDSATGYSLVRSGAQADCRPQPSRPCP